MNVGIFVGAEDPTSGGSHSFVRAVLEGLEAVETSHSLRVLHSGSKELPALGRIPLQRIAQPPRASLAQRVRNRLGGATAARDRHDAWMVDEIDKLGLQLLWFLTPAALPSRVPYVAT